MLEVFFQTLFLPFKSFVSHWCSFLEQFIFNSLYNDKKVLKCYDWQLSCSRDWARPGLGLDTTALPCSYRCTYPLRFQMMSLKMAVLIGNHTSSLNNTQVWLYLICSFTTCQRWKSCSAKKRKNHTHCWVEFRFAWLLEADKRTCSWIHGSQCACKSIPVKLFSCKNLKQHMGEK